MDGSGNVGAAVLLGIGGRFMEGACCLAAAFPAALLNPLDAFCPIVRYGAVLCCAFVLSILFNKDGFCGLEPMVHYSIKPSMMDDVCFLRVFYSTLIPSPDDSWTHDVQTHD